MDTQGDLVQRQLLLKEFEEAVKASDLVEKEIEMLPAGHPHRFVLGAALRLLQEKILSLATKLSSLIEP